MPPGIIESAKVGVQKLSERRKLGKEDETSTQLENAVKRLTSGKSGEGGGSATSAGALLKRINKRMSTVGRTSALGQRLAKAALKLRPLIRRSKP
jgi:hypothetical protein